MTNCLKVRRLDFSRKWAANFFDIFKGGVSQKVYEHLTYIGIITCRVKMCFSLNHTQLIKCILNIVLQHLSLDLSYYSDNTRGCSSILFVTYTIMLFTLILLLFQQHCAVQLSIGFIQCPDVKFTLQGSLMVENVSKQDSC